MRNIPQPLIADDPYREQLAEALEEYHRRTSVGEPVDLGDFRERLGERYERLERVLGAERALDEAMGEGLAGRDEFPRAFGPFTLLSELGRGGMGVVYEALERGLGRKVALKVLHTRCEGEGETFQRFQREARRCASVRHDHIVAILSHGTVDGQAYYAMDLVEGAPLSRLISERRLPEWRVLASSLACVADALQELHGKGVFHRDVKPQNIVVRKQDGRMILVDFGLARHVEDETLTRTGGIVGTPAYMSPEQILGQAALIGPATDVYGLGVALYECLAGHVPFRTSEYRELIELIRSHAPDWPHVSAPDVPVSLERVAIKALYKQPSDRYASAADIARDLRRFAAGLEPEGRLVSRMELGRRWLVRRWKPLAAAGLLLAVLASLWARRAATLLLEATAPEDAVAWVDDVERGRPPLRLSLTPGEHRVQLRRPGFRPVERVVRLGAGDQHTAEFKPLRPNRAEGEDRPDRETLAAYGRTLARLYGLPSPEEDAQSAASGTRGSAGEDGSATVSVLAPRGMVRPGDLTHWWVELDRQRFAPGGRLELRQGSDVLWSSAPFPPGQERERQGRLELSPAAVARLKPGAALAFGYVPAGEGQAPARASGAMVALRVVPEDAASALLARLEGSLTEASPTLVATLRASALRAASLHTAALHQLLSALRADASDLFALRTLRGTLRDAGLSWSEFFRLQVDAALAGQPFAVPGFGVR